MLIFIYFYLPNLIITNNNQGHIKKTSARKDRQSQAQHKRILKNPAAAQRILPKKKSLKHLGRQLLRKESKSMARRMPLAPPCDHEAGNVISARWLTQLGPIKKRHMTNQPPIKLSSREAPWYRSKLCLTHQRSDTLLSSTNSIIDHQQPFFSLSYRSSDKTAYNCLTNHNYATIEIWKIVASGICCIDSVC